jgi:hypothetical protein
MRFHFGNCRHDEAQRNWNELCKSQDMVRELQRNNEHLKIEIIRIREDFHNEALAKMKELKHLKEVNADLQKQTHITQPLYIEELTLNTPFSKGASFVEEKPKRTRKVT